MKHEADYAAPADRPPYQEAPPKRGDLADLAQRVTALEERVTALEFPADKMATRSEIFV